MPPTIDPGLCRGCQWHRVVQGASSTFWMCTRALNDASYRKYPPLPVRACRGFEPLPQAAHAAPPLPE